MHNEHEHHHHDEHDCHDPNCREHHHHDEHDCHDPNCHDPHHHHHHSQAEEIAGGAMIIGEKREIHPAFPVERAAVEARARELFLRLSDALATEGLILGHLKGSVSAPDGSFFAVSVTRLGVADLTYSELWSAGGPLGSFDFTLNLLSLTHRDVDVDAAFAYMDPSVAE